MGICHILLPPLTFVPRCLSSCIKHINEDDVPYVGEPLIIIIKCDRLIIGYKLVVFLKILFEKYIVRLFFSIVILYENQSTTSSLRGSCTCTDFVFDAPSHRGP